MAKEVRDENGAAVGGTIVISDLFNTVMGPSGTRSWKDRLWFDDLTPADSTLRTFVPFDFNCDSHQMVGFPNMKSLGSQICHYNNDDSEPTATSLGLADYLTALAHTRGYHYWTNLAGHSHEAATIEQNLGKLFADFDAQALRTVWKLWAAS